MNRLTVSLAAVLLALGFGYSLLAAAAVLTSPARMDSYHVIGPVTVEVCTGSGPDFQFEPVPADAVHTVPVGFEPGKSKPVGPELAGYRLVLNCPH